MFKFRSTSIASITASLSAMMASLEAHANTHSDHASAKRAQVSTLLTEVDNHRIEAATARQIASNINNILEV